MNKLAILILCFLFTLIVTISSCSNKLNEPGFPGFRCDLANNTEYVADTAYYTKSLGTSIYAYSGSTARFKFFLVHADTTGSYPLDTLGNGNIAYYTDGVTLYQSISGSVSITQYYNDSLKMCTGTFNFVGRVPGSSGNTVTVSYGYFNNIPRH
jgi:hypothetical protein